MVNRKSGIEGLTHWRGEMPAVEIGFARGHQAKAAWPSRYSGMGSSLVAGLLAGRQAFSFREVGAMRLKGLSTPIAACELLYERGEPASSADMPGRGRHGRRTFRQRR